MRRLRLALLLPRIEPPLNGESQDGNEQALGTLKGCLLSLQNEAMERDEMAV